MDPVIWIWDGDPNTSVGVVPVPRQTFDVLQSSFQEDFPQIIQDAFGNDLCLQSFTLMKGSAGVRLYRLCSRVK